MRLLITAIALAVVTAVALAAATSKAPEQVAWRYTDTMSAADREAQASLARAAAYIPPTDGGDRRWGYIDRNSRFGSAPSSGRVTIVSRSGKVAQAFQPQSECMREVAANLGHEARVYTGWDGTPRLVILPAAPRFGAAHYGC